MCSDRNQEKREVRSFLQARDPSIDRRFRPRPTSNTKIRLFDEIQEENSSDTTIEETCSIASSDVASCTNTSHNEDSGALVYLRLRPVEESSKAYTIAEAGNVFIARPAVESSTSNNKNSMEKHYSFSAIFNSSVQQSEVYEKCIGKKIETEENFTVITYGTSGSGKTFTLLGDDENPGIIPRSLENIFTFYNGMIYPQPSLKLEKARVVVQDDNALEKEIRVRRQHFSNGSDLHVQYKGLLQCIHRDHSFQSAELDNVSVLIWISFVEIYNELVYDLLEPPANIGQTMTAPTRKNMKIVGNDGKVFIKGLTSVYVKSSVEALKLLSYGLRRVNYASTSINENSSRSHCVFFVDVIKYYKSGVITENSYKFCDLAGSERLDKTGNVGSRLKEAQRINTSLLVLGRCLDAANNNSNNSNNRKKTNDVIPYRESKLTMILQASLLCKEKLTMIVNVTPTDYFYEENLNVLSFSAIAKNIVFKHPVVKHSNSRYSFFLEQSKLSGIRANEELNALLEEKIFLHSEVNRLNSFVEDLQHRHFVELQQQEHALRNMLVDSFEETLRENKIAFETRLQQELDSQNRLHETKLAALKRKHENEIEDLREELEDKENFTVDSKKRRTID